MKMSKTIYFFVAVMAAGWGLLFSQKEVSFLLAMVFSFTLVPALVAEMGAAYPELVRAQPLIEATLAQEEVRFRQTLATGLRLLDEATTEFSKGGTLPGETAFKLYDTYGLALDEQEEMAREFGLSLDEAGFRSAMEEQRTRARASWKGADKSQVSPVYQEIREHGATIMRTAVRAALVTGAIVAVAGLAGIYNGGAVVPGTPSRYRGGSSARARTHAHGVMSTAASARPAPQRRREGQLGLERAAPCRHPPGDQAGRPAADRGLTAPDAQSARRRFDPLRIGRAAQSGQAARDHIATNFRREQVALLVKARLNQIAAQLSKA